MITDTPCANTTVATLSGAPAMTTSSSSSSSNSSNSSSSTSSSSSAASSSSSSSSSLVTTSAIGGNSGVLGVVGSGTTSAPGGGGGTNSNLQGPGGVATAAPPLISAGAGSGLPGAASTNNQTNCTSLVGTASTGAQVGANQQSSQQQLSPTQQQPLTPQQQLNANVGPTACTNNNNTNCSNNSITGSSNGNGANVTTTSISAVAGTNSINTVSSLMHIKEEPNILDTSKEDDTSRTTPPNMSGINIKKEPMQRMNSNGSANASGIIGSTNTGSLHHCSDKSASDSDDRKPINREGNDLGTDFDANFNIGVLGGKDDLLSENTIGMGGHGSLSNVKKEEPGPDLTSDGFGSLTSSLTSGTGSNSGNVNMPPVSSSCSGSVGSGRMPAGNSPSEGIQPLSSNILGPGKQGGVGGGGGLDYMQQQNHIFVFSTSLANKGAESVLSGQYPTIIAYHCAQPTTKKFLEDFFLKNPLKLSKMNRQNPAQWMSNSIPMMVKTNKTSNNSSGSNSSNNSSNSNRIVPTTKPPTSNNSGFTSDDLPGGDAELLPWEQSGNHMSLDAMANGAGSNVNAPSASDPAGLEVDNLVPGSPSLSGNRSCSNHMPISTTTSGASAQQSSTALTTSALGPTSPSLSGGLQPSLQGVKVPDENLTPQQRQHREEQLAKLKKMNQFLFPEQGGMAPDFVGGGVTPEGDPGVPPGAKMMGPGGPPGQGPVNMIAGMPGSGQMPMSGVPSSLRGSGMLGIGPRAGMCRSMGGPMGPNSLPDGIMGGANINDLSGLSCGVMMGNQQGPGGQSMMGGGNAGPPMGGMMPGSGMGQQSMVQGGPMGPGGPMNPCAVGNPMGPGMMGQSKHMMGGPGMAQMEWNKLQHQFYEERKGKSLDGMGMGGMCPSGASIAGGRQIPPVMRTNSQGGSRSQGPPPPYHQTQRSASVPIATQSPNPGSPNNPTSNLSLPSPRTGSTLNSPAGDHTTPVSSGNQQQQNAGNGGTNVTPGRQQQLPYKQDSPANSGCPGSGGGNNPNLQATGPRGSLSHNSNPSTPLSSHLSPNASLKDLELGTTNSNSGGQGKEPNLMPVPSPQQIQYLNTFEGQELTIQKQPNTTLKDGSIISPPGGNNGPSNGGGSGGGGNNGAGNVGNDNRISGTSTPLTPSSIEPRFPTTPGAGGQVSVGGGGGASAGSTFPIPSSPQTPNTGNSTGQGASEKGQRLNTSGPSPQGSRTPSMSGDPNQGNSSSLSQSSVDSVRFPSTSPGMNFSPVTNQGGGANSQQVNPMKLGGFMDVSPNGKCAASTNDASSSGNFCVRADNLPLNPNSSCPPPVKTSHFDPISSLAQMSQQLTSNVSNSLNGQPGGGGPGPGGGGGGNPSGGIMANFQNHGGMGMATDMSMGGHHVDGLMSGLDPCGMGGVMPGMAQYGMHATGSAGIPLGMMGGPGPRSLSPKLGGGMVGFPGGPVGMPHRMIGRPPMGGSPYNGANIQVKASTPNTIQYLPARPQVGNTNPRAPPSLEFLQRFANPMSSMDGPPNKVPSGQGMPFYPNCNQLGQPGPGGMSMNAHLDAASALGGSDGSGMLGLGGMGPVGPMMGQNLMMRGLRPPGQGGMVRMSGPPHMGGGGGHHHHHPFSNGPPNGPNDPSMFPGNQMFSAGSKGSPMSAGGPNGPNNPNQIPGGGPPDASQPLPPTMGGGQASGGGAFKSSQFVGPSTADPNYAQQYHNFQQQLYATSTRSQISNQPGGGMAGGPTNPNQSFFVPK